MFSHCVPLSKILIKCGFAVSIWKKRNPQKNNLTAVSDADCIVSCSVTPGSGHGKKVLAHTLKPSNDKGLNQEQ